MNDQELQESVEKISEQVEAINRRIGGRWRALGEGVLKGFGSVIGAAAAILIIGWFLNVIGIIPAFQQQASNWQEVIQGLQQNQVQITK